MGQAKIKVADINATGIPSSTTYLRGDNTWSPGAGYEYQDIVIADPIPGTSQGFLEIYGTLDFFP